MPASILVVEDERASRESIIDVLSEERYQTAGAKDGAEALELLESRSEFDLVITDLRMPGMDGLELLKQIRKTCPQTLVILVTAHASVETAVEALREGAHDYMLKPLVYEDMLSKISRLLERRELAWQIQHLRREVESRYDFSNLVGESQSMRQIIGLIRKVAATTSTVLVTGESGVGKEVVARAIHHESQRHDKIFLPINCGAIPENLIESQLFGHVRGAFTGAVTSQEGLFHRAKGGTVFLDEIGDLPLAMQVKLLRTLEDKEIMPVGSPTSVKTNIRIIAATNRDLEDCVKQKTFRDDLFYRLSVFAIDIPPLRERREDIPALIEFLVRRHNAEMKTRFKGVENSAMRTLITLPWRGNVRELDNVIEHAMIVGASDWITSDDLPPRLSDMDETEIGYVADDLKSAMRIYERSHIGTVMRRADDDKRRAAKLLGISLSSLYRKIEDLDLK